MNKKYKIAFFIFLAIGVAIASLLYLKSLDLVVLNPKGMIGLKQRNLFLISSALMLLVIIPVFILAIYVTWQYRASNREAKYAPDWDQSLLAETIWWGVPFIIIVVLSVLTWTSSHELDPFKPIDTGVKPLTIQVIALEWKWLFIYPEQQIATVNFVQFPENTPLVFEITSDAPMNSFWIPQLGGQIYSMPGMKSQLHLIASEVGTYRGASANLSGKGFSSMWFLAQSSTKADFDSWVESVQQSPLSLNADAYRRLAKPSEEKRAFYTVPDVGLFDAVIMKYMMPPKPVLQAGN